MTSNIIAKVYGAPEQGLWETFQWDQMKRKIKYYQEINYPFTALVNDLTGEQVQVLASLRLNKFFHPQALL